MQPEASEGSGVGCAAWRRAAGELVQRRILVGPGGEAARGPLGYRVWRGRVLTRKWFWAELGPPRSSGFCPMMGAVPSEAEFPGPPSAVPFYMHHPPSSFKTVLPSAAQAWVPCSLPRHVRPSIKRVPVRLRSARGDRIQTLKAERSAGLPWRRVSGQNVLSCSHPRLRAPGSEKPVVGCGGRRCPGLGNPDPPFKNMRWQGKQSLLTLLKLQW